MISAAVIGLAEFVASTKAAPKAVAKAVRAKRTEIAGKVVEQMKERVAVDDGELRDSIRTEPTETGVTIRAGDTPDTLRPGKSGIVHDVALSTEYGTARQPAKPFFWPVIREHEKELVRAGGEAADEAMKDG